MALGAQRGQVLGLVLRQAMVLSLCGVMIGVAGWFAATPLDKAGTIVLRGDFTHSFNVKHRFRRAWSSTNFTLFTCANIFAGKTARLSSRT
jgi:hypothetical protein